MTALTPSLVLGRVIEAEETVEGLKARVKRLDQGGDIESDWMQVAMPMASAEGGMSFLPYASEEDGDMAVIGQYGAKPVILGFIYGKKQAVPTDKPEELTILSRKKNKLVMTDTDEGGILLEDMHGNKIEMGKEGIKITSDKDITVEAGGTAFVKGTTVELN
ncbi:phage baseplate assembly protein V [Cognatishimia sp. MH4019]|uniref:phage baseplate assembly protein V n=1 Tax=Cognatishimia sp. MH4019 TaxID=2854030 RepID=UPI001CD7A094|nr:phage baseplate assembly protein V [Cognatishimia sp. MH4019]